MVMARESRSFAPLCEFCFFLIIISKKKTHAQTLEKKRKKKGKHFLTS